MARKPARQEYHDGLSQARLRMFHILASTNDGVQISCGVFGPSANPICDMLIEEADTCSRQPQPAVVRPETTVIQVSPLQNKPYLVNLR